MTTEAPSAEFQVGCTLEYWINDPAALVFNVEAARFDRQTVRQESLAFTPGLPAEPFVMPESGNRYVRVRAEPGTLRVDYHADITLAPIVCDPAAVHEVPPERLPLDVLTHVYPSRYCQSDRLSRFAERAFGRLTPGHLRVGAICNWICANVEYRSGSTDALTSAADTLLERQGVCRDFAHLAIALCRALGIPARYVSAYAWRLHPPDFHAVFEAWLDGPGGGGWYLFDPTRKSGVDGLVRIGVGRDAGEVAFCTIFGNASGYPPEVWIKGPDDTGPITCLAVSTASV